MAVRPVTAFPGTAGCHEYWKVGVSRILEGRMRKRLAGQQVGGSAAGEAAAGSADFADAVPG